MAFLSNALKLLTVKTGLSFMWQKQQQTAISLVYKKLAEMEKVSEPLLGLNQKYLNKKRLAKLKVLIYLLYLR